MDSENGMEYFKLVHNDDIVDMWYVFSLLIAQCFYFLFCYFSFFACRHFTCRVEFEIPIF